MWKVFMMVLPPLQSVSLNFEPWLGKFNPIILELFFFLSAPIIRKEIPE